MMPGGTRRPRVFTMGHGDISIDEFFSIIERSSVRLIADMRSNPAAVRFPWFERHTLALEIEKHGLSYRWFRNLGMPNSTIAGTDSHVALAQEADRRYAVAMNTEAFEESCRDLIGLAASTVTVLFGEERDPENSQRSLLADKLMIMGVRVVHILGLEESVEHVLHPGLEVEHGKLTYRGKQLSLI